MKQEQTFCLKKLQKNIQFLSNNPKNILFLAGFGRPGGGGQEPPSGRSS
jgi:hypothetical protein